MFFSKKLSLSLIAFVLLSIGSVYLLQSVITPFWLDEIYTAVVCHLPNGSVTDALQHGADGNPPFFYWITRLSLKLISDEHLALRLPEVLGTLIAFAATYLFLAKRVDRLSAATGMALLCLTPMSNQAHQARPYGVLMAFLGVAMVAWQRIDERKIYALVMSLALAAAEGVHYYAVLVWPVFAIAELIYWRTQGRLRPLVWGALALGSIPLFLNLKLLFGIRQAFGDHFWAQPAFGLLITAHDWLFDLRFAGVVAVALLTVAIFGPVKQILPAHERTFAFTLLWLPVVMVMAARLGHGGMTYRYMLATLFAAAIIAGSLLSKADQNFRWVTLAAIPAAFLITQAHELHQLISYSALSPAAILQGSLLSERRKAQTELESLLTAQDKSRRSLPVVVSAGNAYLPMAFYTPASLRGQLYGIAEPESALKYAKTDSVDLAMRIIKNYWPFQVLDQNTLLSRHSHFLLVSDGGDFDWWPSSLIEKGYVLRWVGSTRSGRIFDVTAPDFAPAAGATSR